MTVIQQPEFLQSIADLAPTLAVTVAYGQVLPQAFLDIPPCGTVNLHPSLLPKYRGAAPVPWALLNGDSETGISVAYTVSCGTTPFFILFGTSVQTLLKCMERCSHSIFRSLLVRSHLWSTISHQVSMQVQFVQDSVFEKFGWIDYYYLLHKRLC